MALKVRIEKMSASLSDIALTGQQTISAKDAGALDRDLMDVGGFSLDQLMELAGLSVSQVGMSQWLPSVSLLYLVD
jgi:NAD(P)H-hydrate repair Nnr-like enzyme with NAD(P)H-hydrate epimerase domain